MILRKKINLKQKESERGEGGVKYEKHEVMLLIRKVKKKRVFYSRKKEFFA